jgi:hypothetical protein
MIYGRLPKIRFRKPHFSTKLLGYSFEEGCGAKVIGAVLVLDFD